MITSTMNRASIAVFLCLLVENPHGWFEPHYLNKALTKVRNNGCRVQER